MSDWKGSYRLHEFTSFRISCPGCGREELSRINRPTDKLQRRCPTPGCYRSFVRGNRRIRKLRGLLRDLRADRTVRLETHGG